MQVMRISEVVIISMFMLASASALNMRAAYPGEFVMPVPTALTLANPLRVWIRAYSMPSFLAVNSEARGQIFLRNRERYVSLSER